MAKLLKLRRGTTTQHASFAGAEGELTIDITKDTAVVHDGTTGGKPLAREDMSNVSSASIAGRLGTGAIQGTQLENSGVTAGAYGSSSAIPIVTVDAQGLVTAASTTAIDSTTIANGSASVAVSNNGPITSNANHDFSAGIDVTGQTTTEALLIEKSSGNVNATIKSNDAIASIEVGGQTSAFIDLKTPASDDYDIRYVSDGYIYSKNDINLQPDTGKVVKIRKNLDALEGVDVTGDITCTGTVDGVDVAGQNTLMRSVVASTGNLNSGVTGTTPSTSDNTTKVATTAFVRNAISTYGFPSGTLMLFAQTSAPTGWTKSTTHNNKALRVVSGTAGSGGNNAFSNTLADRGITANAANATQGGNVSVTVANSTQGGNVSVANTTAGGNLSISSTSTSGTVNSHSLSVNEMPSHSHAVQFASSRNQWRSSGGPGLTTSSINNSQNQYRSSGSTNVGIANTGGNGGHSHGFSGGSHDHTGSLTGTAHTHNATFTGSAHTHNATGSFSGSAHNHSISVGNLDMAVQYVDVIIASKD